MVWAYLLRQEQDEEGQDYHEGDGDGEDGDVT